MESEGCPIYANIDLEGVGIGPPFGSVSFDIRPWLEQASEEDVSRLFNAEYEEAVNWEIVAWSMRRDPGLKQKLEEATSSTDLCYRVHLIQRPRVDMPATADWVALNRTGWEFVPDMCRDWGIDLLVVMARQGEPARRNPEASA
jgi:hypothetical protein